VAAEVFGGDAADEAVEIGHGRRPFVCPANGGAAVGPATVGHS
jgi:hypothetical protein